MWDKEKGSEMVVVKQRRRWNHGLHVLTVLGMLWALFATAFPVAANTAQTTAIPTPVTTGVPRFEPGACAYSLPKGLTDGQNIVCGYVVVAEKHANPGGKTIKLPVAVVKSTSATPAAEPIVLLAGGPGQSGQVFASSLDPSGNFAKLVTAKNDVVFFDQRGTGKAQPSLICTEFLEVAANPGKLRLKQPMVQTLGMEDDELTLLNKCRDRLVASGADLAAYTTTENAADVNDVRIALGYAKINIIGASYGSELGLAVARDWGQFVRTNNLVSIVPIQVPWYYQSAQAFDAALNALFADCAANAACNASYPNLKGSFQKAVADLNAKPALITIKDPQTGKVRGQLPLTGDDYVAVLFQFFYVTSVIPYVPDIMARAARGDFIWLENLIGLLLDDGSDPISIGMHYSIVCSKDPSQANLNAVVEANKAILPEVRKVLEPSAAQYFAVCGTWPSKNADPKGMTAAKSDVPTTLVSGQFDPITPPRYAAIAKETLPNATSVTLRGGGHSAIGPTNPAGACGLSVMLSLIARGTTADTGCANQLQTTYAKLPAAISGDPAPSPSPSSRPSPSPSPSATPRPSPSPSVPPTPLPSPPATGNGGFLPGLPNTGAGAVDAPAVAPSGNAWWLLLPILLAAPLVYRLRRREHRS